MATPRKPFTAAIPKARRRATSTVVIELLPYRPRNPPYAGFQRNGSSSPVDSLFSSEDNMEEAPGTTSASTANSASSPQTSANNLGLKTAAATALYVPALADSSASAAAKLLRTSSFSSEWVPSLPTVIEEDEDGADDVGRDGKPVQSATRADLLAEMDGVREGRLGKEPFPRMGLSWKAC